MDDSRWAWAFVQWQANHGPCVAPIIAMVIAMVWHLIRRAAQIEGGLRQILRTQKRNEIRRSGKSVAGSSLVAALIFLALYFGTTPPIANKMDAHHRVQYARLAQPAQAWQEIAEITKGIRADKKTMVRLQAEIDEWNRQLAEQEARQEEEQ
jgi:septal ring factor EnvC (AmiA/AmiB activator)